MSEQSSNDTNSEAASAARRPLLIVGVVQSIALLLLHKSMMHAVWPATDPLALYAGYAIAIGLPLFLYLGVVRWRARSTVLAVLALLPLLGWAGWHTGWVEAPYFAADDHDGAFPFTLGFSLALSLFIAAFYFRSWQENGGIHYGRLLDNSWCNALLLAFLGLFMLVFWLLLWLWASLFEVIGIEFFEWLFERVEFIYPVSGLVGGWGLGLIRGRVELVATVRRLCETLTSALLPLVAFILVIFIGALPFTGLESLWKTGHATSLVLALAAILLFFVNASGAGAEPSPARRWQLWLVLAALLVAPANSVLASWAMFLRVDQYGWSLERLWAVFCIVFIAAYSLDYAVIALYQRRIGLPGWHRLNIWLGAALAAALLLVNTPIIEFRRIAADDQVERLVAGRTKIHAFDARYLRFDLGAYGLARLNALKTSEFARTRPKVPALVDDALAAKDRWDIRRNMVPADVEQLRQQYVALPGTTLDDAFLLLQQKSTDVHHSADACVVERFTGVVGDFVYRQRAYRAVVSGCNGYFPGDVWRKSPQGWERVGSLRPFGCPLESYRLPRTSQPFVPLATDFFVLRDGPCFYQVEPDPAVLKDAR